MKTVELLQPHVHGAIQKEVGSLLVVRDKTAEWMVAQGIARVRGEVTSSAEAPALFKPPTTAATRYATGVARKTPCCGRR